MNIFIDIYTHLKIYNNAMAQAQTFLPALCTYGKLKKRNLKYLTPASLQKNNTFFRSC